jgi:hypothetical protein
MEFKIHIFCGTSNLCKLIEKSFIKDLFSFNCSEIKDKIGEEIFEKINYSPDCIIVDKDIEVEFKDKIIKKFSAAKVVLLPSLNESEQQVKSENVIQISEPFKLSELGEVLKELYHSKQSEESVN